MNVIRIFLVAWIVEHPRMPRMVRGDAGTLDFIFPSPKVQDINTEEVSDNSDAYRDIDDCSLLCKYDTIAKKEFKEISENNVYSENLLSLFNRTIGKELKKTVTNDFLNGNVYCNCDLDVRISRSVDSLKLPPFAQSQTFSDLELKKRVEKDLKMLLNDAITGNKRLLSSDHLADVLLSIPSPLRYSDELLPEQYEREIVVETENASIRNEDLTLLTEDFTNIEKSLDKNLSLIRKKNC
jgi:hypothetical protein